MTDEIELQKAVTRASRAKALLDSDLLRETHDKIEADLIQKWINTGLEDTAGREMTWHMLRANRRHKQLLEQYVSNGSVAKVELEKHYADVERRKKFGII